MSVLLCNSLKIRVSLPMINGRAGLLLPEGYYSNDQPDSSLATIVGDAQDFFRYTSGRWVWSEEQQLQENYSEFNIAKLEKIGEGSYNKSFSLTIPNKMKVIAQAPNSNAGPAFLTTASEVVTMDFVSDVTR